MSAIENTLLLGWISHWEILLFAGILMLLFGGAKLPGLMRNMGRSVNEFKAGIKEKPQDDPKYVDGKSEPSDEESDGASDGED